MHGVDRQWFLEAFLSQCGNFHDRIILVLVHFHLKTWSFQASKIEFWFSKPFNVLHTIHDKILKVVTFLHCGSLFCNCSTTCGCSLLWTGESLPLQDALFITRTKIFPQVFLFIATYFCSLLLPHNTFLGCFTYIKLKISPYFSWNN